jgi:hypothetical protein
MRKEARVELVARGHALIPNRADDFCKAFALRSGFCVPGAPLARNNVMRFRESGRCGAAIPL